MVPRPRTLAAAVLAVAAVVGAALLWRAGSRSTPVSKADAVAGFRAGAGAGAGAAVRPGVPATGVYTYRVSGREEGAVGPLTLSRALPAEARYVVTAGRGGYAAELRVSGEHVEAYRYAVGGGWIRATWRRVDVTFLRLGRDDRRGVTPPARWVPVHPRVGMRWNVAFRTGTLVTRGEGVVVGRGTLPVAGRREGVVVVRTRTRTTGPHGGMRDETLWWSPRLALPVRMVAVTHLGGVVAFRARMRLDLASAAPAR